MFIHSEIKRILDIFAPGLGAFMDSRDQDKRLVVSMGKSAVRAFTTSEHYINWDNG